MPILVRAIHLPPLLIISLSLAAGACGLRRPPAPIDRSQDSRIGAEVAARLGAEPSIDAASIRVVAEGGMVMLHGSVRGIGAWQCAITNAELVPGVQSVVDYLVIERGERDVTCLAPRPDSSFIVGGPGR
jgi:hypothetical protein